MFAPPDDEVALDDTTAMGLMALMGLVLMLAG